MLVGTRILTEVVSPSIFGAVSLLVGTATLAYNVFPVPIGQAALRYYPEAATNGLLAPFTRVLRSYFVRATGLLVLAALLTGAVFRKTLHQDYSEFVALGALMAADIARTFGQCLLNAARHQRAYAVWSAAEAWLRPLIAVTLVVLLGASVTHVLAGYCAATALMFALMYRTAVPSTKVPASDERATLGLGRSLLSYALPLTPIAFVNWISSSSDRYLIGWTHGLDEVGTYSAGYGLAARPAIVLSLTLITVLRPIYYSAVSSTDRQGAARTLRLWLLLSLGLGLALTALVYVTRHWLVLLALSPRYRAAAELLPPIALGYVFLSIAQMYETVCLAYKRPGLVTAIEVGGALVSLAIEIPLIWSRGAVGAAWSVPAYYGAQMILAAFIARSVVKRADAAPSTVRE